MLPNTKVELWKLKLMHNAENGRWLQSSYTATHHMLCDFVSDDFKDNSLCVFFTKNSWR